MGNYITIHHLTENGVERHTSRKTISSLAEELQEDNFIRCHRSHLVNMNYVQQAEGNTKGLKLTTYQLEEKVQYVAGIRAYREQNRALPKISRINLVG